MNMAKELGKLGVGLAPGAMSDAAILKAKKKIARIFDQWVKDGMENNSSIARALGVSRLTPRRWRSGAVLGDRYHTKRLLRSYGYVVCPMIT